MSSYAMPDAPGGGPRCIVATTVGSVWSAVGDLPLSPMALYRLVCTSANTGFGQSVTRCGLPLPTSFLADEKLVTVSLTRYGPDGPCRRSGLWESKDASAAALTQSYGEFQRVGC